MPAPYPRATSVQKCIRTHDIEEVGKTPRHGTFFQMNGNFSFGDYFKEQAPSRTPGSCSPRPRPTAATASTEKDLWVTVYEDDDEAIELWKKIAGLPDERIQRLGKDTNYWHTGQPGPAGPCSEIFFDRGPEYGIDGGPATDDDRYVEIWNLVFMQYLHRRREVEDRLPHRRANCRRRTSTPAWAWSASRSSSRASTTCTRSTRCARCSTAPPSSRGRRYGADHDDDVRMRVIADHVRSSAHAHDRRRHARRNEGRGYILRRLLRRSIRAMRLLGVEGPTFARAVRGVARRDEGGVPRGRERLRPHIEQLALGEEETFLRTLASGTTILDVAVADDQAGGPRASSPATPRSCCTTPSASRSTSPSRSPRRPASRSTAPRSTRS